VTYWNALDDVTNTGRISANNPFFRGYINASYGTLDSPNVQAIYTGNPNGTVGHKTLVSGTGATAGVQTKTPLFFYAGNLNGSVIAGTYVNRTYSFMAAHYGMKQAESQVFFNLIQAMRVGLGDGYINPDPVADWVNGSSLTAERHPPPAHKQRSPRSSTA
jgi:hypothetical protein